MARYELVEAPKSRYEEVETQESKQPWGDRLARMMGMPPMTDQQRSAIQDMQARPFGSGVPKFAYELGGKATDLATNVGATPQVAAGMGVTANFLTQAIPAFLLSGRFMDAPAQSLLRKPAEKLMQSAVKPSISDLKSGDAGKAISTMLDEGIYPTQGGMAKASTLADDLEKQVQSAIAQSNARVGVAAAGSRLRDPYNRALNQVNPQGDLAAIRSVWDEFRTSPQIAGKTDIPVQLAQELKKGTYRALGNKAYGEVGAASVEAQKALARGLREEISKAVPQIADPLKREAALMNVKDVAGNRALMEANKNPLGLAALRMDNPLSAATFMADRWAALKAFLALQANSLGKPQVLGPTGAAASMATSRPALYQED
jgi:hypothetical protein